MNPTENTAEKPAETVPVLDQKVEQKTAELDNALPPQNQEAKTEAKQDEAFDLETEVMKQMDAIGVTDKKPVEEKPVEKPVEEAQGKPADEVTDDAILGELSSERSKSRVKHILAERNELNKTVEGMHTMLSQAGITPKDLAEMVDYSRLINSQKPEDLEMAAQILAEQQKVLSIKLGKPIGGVDFLGSYEDIKTSLENGELSQERATELARLRMSEDMRKKQNEAYQQQAMSQKNLQQELANASIEFNKVFSALSQEVDAPIKMEAIKSYLSNPQNMQAFVNTYHPSQWAPAIKMMYDQVKVATPKAASPVSPISTRNINTGVKAINTKDVGAIAQQVAEQMGL